MHHILGMRADSAEDAEDGLDEEGRLDQLAIKEVLQVVQMRDVVTFEFEARVILVTGGQDVLDVLK